MKYYIFFSISVISIAILQHEVDNDDFNTEMSC